MREWAKDESMTICGVFMLQRRKHRSLRCPCPPAPGDRLNSGRSVLGFRGDQLRQGAHLLAPVGQEGDVLVCLQSLAFQEIEQAAFRLRIVAVHQPEVSGALSSGIERPTMSSKLLFRSSQLRT